MAILLFGLAAGYWVITLALQQKDRVRKLGLVLGILIILLSLVGMVCTVACPKKACPKPWGACAVSDKACPTGGSAGKVCPKTGKVEGSHGSTYVCPKSGPKVCTTVCPKSIESSAVSCSKPDCSKADCSGCSS